MTADGSPTGADHIFLISVLLLERAGLRRETTLSIHPDHQRVSSFGKLQHRKRAVAPGHERGLASPDGAQAIGK